MNNLHSPFCVGFELHVLGLLITMTEFGLQRFFWLSNLEKNTKFCVCVCVSWGGGSLDILWRVVVRTRPLSLTHTSRALVSVGNIYCYHSAEKNGWSL